MDAETVKAKAGRESGFADPIQDIEPAKDRSEPTGPRKEKSRQMNRYKPSILTSAESLSCFRLLLPLDAGLLVMLALAYLGKDAAAAPLKPAKSAIEGFVLANPNLGHDSSLPPSVPTAERTPRQAQALPLTKPQIVT